MAAKGGRTGGKPPRVPGAPPPLPRAARRRIYPRDRGSTTHILWTRARRAWHRGDVYKAIHTLSSVVSGVGAGLVVGGGAKAATAGKVIVGVSAPVAVFTGIGAAKKRAAFELSGENLAHLREVHRTEDVDWLRKVDHAFVRRYATDPRGVRKELNASATGAAYIFASARRLRRAPNARYSIKRHESRTFYDLVRPILQVKVSQLPRSVDRSAILKHHFPRESLRPMKVEKLAPEISSLIPEHLLTAEPQTPAEAVALTLLAGAIARAKLKEFRD